MTLKRGCLSVLVMAFIASAGLQAFPDDDCKSKSCPPALQTNELAVKIDRFIEAGLAARGIEPAPLAGDAEFMRRVYLDLTGRIPSETEARAFLANKAADRRAKLVDSLLANPLYVQHMANTWQNVMAPSASNSQFASNQPGFRTWLEKQVRDNAPYDKMVRELLTAPMYNPSYATTYSLSTVATPTIGYYTYPTPGYSILIDPNIQPVPINPVPSPAILPLPAAVPLQHQSQITNLAVPQPVLPLPLLLPSSPQPVPQSFVYQAPSPPPSPGGYFFEVNEYKAENLAASAARQFLGVRLECAQCHNHPFSKWSRKQFWEFATFFTAIQAPQPVFYYTNNNFQPISVAPPVVPAARREMKIPGTEKTVEARFLDGIAPQWKDNADSRQVLAEWLTDPSNNLFARTAANRLWAHFFGSGIIDPIDDEPTSENPASHPELLDELTAQFVAHKYDVQTMIRAITASKAYQRSSVASHPCQNEPRSFARMAVKGVSPEQLFDNLALATGYHYPNAQPDVIVPNTPRGDFLLLFATQDKRTETQTSILQALTLMNGKLVADATSMTASPKLTAVLNGKATNAERIESLYLSTLSRFPRPEEAARMLRYVDGGGARNDSGAALADVYWALLNSSEFMFNH